jgi:hypothetical protein
MSTLTEDAKLQILHDHYKDTFSLLREYTRSRGRVLLFILVVVTLMLFQVASPKDAEIAMSEFVVKRLDLKSPIDISFVGSVIWFSLLCLAIRYFQTVVLIERQYRYIHRLEDQLSPTYDGKAFTREGKSYLSNYPLFSSWADKLYKIVFPALLLFVVAIKMFGEWHYGYLSVTLIFNSLMALLILVSTILYLLLIHFGK